ncbi:MULTISPECIES: NAD-dependent epimerase/dehydratase family protein [Actibacterium]|uniref:CDP-paratose 2-epimerase n=1 Tax=Actibacterium naphthalenivorans TaxID=1614693 RepID=A0A840CEJ0_9RHOB|nr:MULTISPECIES: NAD-dependent epimerase/dehydratase family protein [Actibacterium]ALG89209.1 NAD-dependent dehydratase [Actibacterium sp. EMB200-NS6]MBB4021206.1 CDP-paratose 2-epimerase [Actibacterium naphthalenivorans]
MSRFGFVEWFRPGDRERVEAVLPMLEETGASWLRTHLSWADYHAPGGPEWYDWLIPRLSRNLELVPCVHYTPPSLSRTGRTSGAPKVLKDLPDFCDTVMSRYGAHFEHLELWNEPNNLLDYDWREDPGFELFCEMIDMAAYWIRERGWKPVLGGPCPFDPYWLDLMGQRGILSYMHAVGFHGFPGTWDSEEGSWTGWDMHLGEMRAILDRHNRDAEIWITETGYSTWRRDEMEQVRRFMQALDAPAARIFWYGWQDLQPDVAVQEGLWFDPRHYHLGAITADGQPKLLARMLAEGGVARLREVTRLSFPALAGGKRPVVVTGGAGFIGSNLSESLLADGQEVLVLDNLSRPGVEENLGWLSAHFGARVHPAPFDLRDTQALNSAVRDAAAVFHLAAQTAVTTSLDTPVEDFEVNARGTLNVLEAVRASGREIPLVFASTNKVYGALADIDLHETAECVVPADAAQGRGVTECRPLDFCTPYGCSKGVADQYVMDYAHSYGLKAAVLRMSCIYGPRQFGTEDQGWLAHFLISALRGDPLTIYGSGRQVRDVCEVSDAVAAYRMVHDRIDALSGRAFNLGGGPANAISLRQALAEITRVTGVTPEVVYRDWRQGDQPWFVADTAALTAATGWRARTDWRQGIARLAGWLAEHRVHPEPERILA